MSDKLELKDLQCVLAHSDNESPCSSQPERLTLRTGPQPDYADVATVWASVIGTESGNETSAAGAVTADTIYNVTLRDFPGVTSQWRITWGTKTLDIISVFDPDGRKRQLNIKAVENQSNG